MKITTNNRPRAMVTWHDIPVKMQEDFDYLDEDARYSERLVKYKGRYIDIFDTQGIRVSGAHDNPMGWSMYVAKDDPLSKWRAISSETFFSGVLFRLIDDGVIIGRYYA